MSRAKGNRLERNVARAFVDSDGVCPLYGHLASSTGRVGHLDLGADIITRNFAVECKNREDITDRLWTWLDHISVPAHTPLLVVKKNRRLPLVVARSSDFLDLVDAWRS